MVLGSFQCQGILGILLLWHMVGQGPAVLAAGAGRVGCPGTVLRVTDQLDMTLAVDWAVKHQLKQTKTLYT